jgi:predicted small lipoprotein YifL
MKRLLSLLSITGLLILGGCGQKGDLYHTEDAPPPNLEKSADQ